MTEPRGFDLDGETRRAWVAFERRLADHLGDMREGSTLALRLGRSADESADGGPALVFSVSQDGLVHCEARSADDTVDEAQVQVQVLPRREAETLAAEAVRLLRDVYAVMHPAFLQVRGDLRDDSAVGGPSASYSDIDTLGVTEPVDSAHLVGLTVRTIARDLGREPTRDADGDIVMEFGSARVFVRVLDETPVIKIFGRLVHDVRHPEAAPGVVAALNNDYPFVKFMFAENAVLACVHLPAIPFVPAHLRHMLASFAQLADELDDQLVRRLGGDREIEPTVNLEAAVGGQPEGLPPELMTLMRLDPDGRGLDPEHAARVCSYDRGLARQLLHIAGGQEEVWRAAADESGDDPGEEARCAEEAAGWQATRRSLAGALALIDSREG